MKELKPKDPTLKAIEHARHLLKEEMHRLEELHEPPMPSAVPAVTLPLDRRRRKEAASQKGGFRGRRGTDQKKRNGFVV